MTPGPLQILVVDFEDPNFQGDIADELERLEAPGTLRVLDLAFVTKDRDGVINAGMTHELHSGAMVRMLLGMDVTADTPADDLDLYDAAAAIPPGTGGGGGRARARVGDPAARRRARDRRARVRLAVGRPGVPVQAGRDADDLSTLAAWSRAAHAAGASCCSAPRRWPAGARCTRSRTSCDALGAALGEPDVQSAATPTGIFVSLGDDEPAGFESVGPPLRFDQAAAVTAIGERVLQAASSARRRRSGRCAPSARSRRGSHAGRPRPACCRSEPGSR